MLDEGGAACGHLSTPRRRLKITLFVTLLRPELGYFNDASDNIDNWPEITSGYSKTTCERSPRCSEHAVPLISRPVQSATLPPLQLLLPIDSNHLTSYHLNHKLFITGFVYRFRSQVNHATPTETP